MSPERFRQIEELYHAAREGTAEERALLLAQTDPELRREVESLLADPIGGEFMDRPAIHNTPELMEDYPSTVVSAGARLGPYCIESKLGEGGMGVVFRAVDTRLGRPVAIKFVQPQFTSRLDREARAISSLNHPNICTLYDIGPNYFVMELLEGDTIAARLKDGPLPVEQTLHYASQIAAALADAHEHGIVHRDLKPANVMLVKSGVKVLDFGLASFERAPGLNGETRTRQPTQTEAGMVIGTAAYMSPEQAEGKRVDARTDIFSFGAVLYEMITGRRAFSGGSALSILSAILREEPKPASEIIKGLPRELGRIVTRCLQKDPNRRYQHAGDLKIDLQQVKEELAAGGTAVRDQMPREEMPEKLPLRRSWIIPIAVCGAIVLVVAAAAWWMKTATDGDTSVQAPVLTRLTSDSSLTTDPALSPGDNLFAYASDRSGEGNLDIWVKQIAGGEPIRLTRDPADDHEPSFSPDGSQIVFRSEREGGGVYLISTLGGESRKVADLGRRPRFSPDGKLIAYWVGELYNNTTGAVYLVPASGGPAGQFLTNFGWMAYPVWSPDGRYLLFLGRVKNQGPADWWVAPAKGGQPVKVKALDTATRQGLSGSLIPTDWLQNGNRILFAATLGGSSNIWALALNTSTWEAAAQPRRLTFGAGNEAQPSINKSGRFLFAALNQNVDVWALPADGDLGKITGPIQRVTQDAAIDNYPFVSIDGTKIAFGSDRSGTRELWLKDFATGVERRPSIGVSLRRYARISADASRIAYCARDGSQLAAFVVSTGGGVARKVIDNCDFVFDWAPDDTGLLFCPPGPPWYIAWFDLTTGEKRDLIKPKQNVYEARFSPDGRWIAFHSQNRNETRQIFITPFRDHAVPGPDGWIPITDGTGMDRDCYWSPDGNLLYYQSEREGYRCIFARRVDPNTKRPVGSPFPIYHAHQARLSLSPISSGDAGLSVARDKVVFSQAETTGNIWMAQPADGAAKNRARYGAPGAAPDPRQGWE